MGQPEEKGSSLLSISSFVQILKRVSKKSLLCKQLVNDLRKMSRNLPPFLASERILFLSPENHKYLDSGNQNGSRNRNLRHQNEEFSEIFTEEKMFVRLSNRLDSELSGLLKQMSVAENKTNLRNRQNQMPKFEESQHFREMLWNCLHGTGWIHNPYFVQSLANYYHENPVSRLSQSSGARNELSYLAMNNRNVCYSWTPILI